MKDYLTIDEACASLLSGSAYRITRRDILDLAARSKLRLCCWYNGLVASFEDNGPFECPVPTGASCTFRGYIQIPPDNIRPPGDITAFERLIAVEVVQCDEPNIFSKELSCFEFLGAYFVDTVTGNVIPRSFNIAFDEIVIPRPDLERLLPSKNELPTSDQRNSASKPMTARERDTLLVLIAALCQHSAIDWRNRGAAPRIREIVEELGASVSEDTIRDCLARMPEAFEKRLR